MHAPENTSATEAPAGPEGVLNIDIPLPEPSVVEPLEEPTAEPTEAEDNAGLMVVTDSDELKEIVARAEVPPWGTRRARRGGSSRGRRAVDGAQLFEGFPIDFTWPDGKGRVRDIDVALHLELARPRNIREVAKGMPTRLGKVEPRTRRVRSRGIDGIVREMPVEEGWYTEAQAIWVATQLRTGR